MGKHWLRRLRKEVVASCAALAVATGITSVGRGQAVAPPVSNDALQTQLATQQREIDDLKRMLQTRIEPAAPTGIPKSWPALGVQPVANADQPPEVLPNPPGTGTEVLPNPPGTGMVGPGQPGKSEPPKFNGGYDPARGFFLDANYDPGLPFADNGALPFELRIRGRIQADYYGYDVRDDFNHLTHVEGTARDAPNESVLEVKRMRLIFAGYMWEKNLRYQIQFDGNSRGLAGEDTRQDSFTNPEGNFEGGQNITNVDGGVRLLEAWVAYDFLGDADGNGYRSAFTLIAGKMKPMGSYEEYLGSANAQFVEFAMASWMFDTDADNYIIGAGFQYHAMEDKLYMMGLVTSGA